MDKNYERKKVVENLGIISKELPNLKRILQEQGVESFNYHSKPATEIGKASGNPSSWNKTAFMEAEKYYNRLEGERAKYEGDEEIEGLLDETKDNLKEVRITLRNLEGKTGMRKTLTVLSISSILAGIFFLSPNLTGNIIGNLVKNSSDIFGGLLFLLGLVGAFFTLRR